MGRRRRRKDFTSLLRNIERPSELNTAMGVASSIGGDGGVVNGQGTSDGEIRDLFFALPYGISSSGLDGIRVQMIKNDNQNNVAVGVVDSNKPPVRSGCIIIYDKSGSQIRLNGDGSITLVANTIRVETSDTKFTGSVSFGSGMSVDKSGNITMNNNVKMNGNVEMSQKVSMSGGADISGTTSITGTATLNGRTIETV